jgi:hypothetical protein
MTSIHDVFDSHFHRQVEEMRLKIESLPREQRPHLWALLEATQRQHDELRDSCTQIRTMMDRLVEAENA